MREIRTIDSEKYEKVEGSGKLKHVGNITGQEAFDQLKAHLEAVGMLPDEYFSPSIYGEMNRELPDFRTAVCHTDWGGSEGVYIDIDLMYVEDRTRKYFHLATGKTLDDSGEAFMKMSRIAAECSMMLNGRGCIVRVPESSYEAQAAKENVELNAPEKGTESNKDNKIKIDLGFATLVAEQGSDPNYKEVFVGLEDEQGCWSQDLAVIRGKYHYENGEVVYDGDISVKIYADQNNEDYTHDFTVGVYSPEEELEETPSFDDRLKSAASRAGGSHASAAEQSKAPEKEAEH